MMIGRLSRIKLPNHIQSTTFLDPVPERFCHAMNVEEKEGRGDTVVSNYIWSTSTIFVDYGLRGHPPEEIP